MGFTYTVDRQYVEGSKRACSGTYTSADGSTGGNIETGLNVVEFLYLTQKSDAVVASAPTINETFPFADPGTTSTNAGRVTIVTAANETGYWKALGR